MKSLSLVNLIIFAVLCSCNQLDLQEEISSEQTQIKIKTRASDNMEESLPLNVYAFDAQNNILKECITINDLNESLEMNLAKGDYHIVALSGLTNTQNINNVNSTLSLPSTNFSNCPIRMGSSDVNITKDATLTLLLYNKVASIDLTLSDIPEDATDVSVSFSLLNNQISLNGSTSGQTAATVKLKAQGNNVWKADKFYTLPSSNKTLNMSITIKQPTSQNTYSFSHPTPLEENTPYIINGSFEKGFALNNQIEIGEWNETKTIDFKFGKETSTEEVPPTEDNNDQPQNNEIFYATEYPKEGDVWNGHFVGLVMKAFGEESAEVVLLSKKEWEDMPSAQSETSSDVAIKTAAAYMEGDLSNWRIPTEEEARYMYDLLGNFYLEETNKTLEENGFPILSTGSVGSTTIRYLCEDAKTSFNWDKGSFTACGAKRTYHLRAVKSIKVIINSSN